MRIKKELGYILVMALLILQLCRCVAGMDPSPKAESWEPVTFSPVLMDQAAESHGAAADATLLMLYGKAVPVAQMCASGQMYYLQRTKDADGRFDGMIGLYQCDLEGAESVLLCKMEDGGGIYRDLVATETGVYWLREENRRGSYVKKLTIMKYDPTCQALESVRTFTDAAVDMAFAYLDNRIYRFLDREHEPSTLLVYDESTGEETVCMEAVYGGSLNFIAINDGMIGLISKKHWLQRYQVSDGAIRDAVRLKDGSFGEMLVVNDRYAAFLTSPPSPSLSSEPCQIAVYDYEQETGFLVAGLSAEMAPTYGVFCLQDDRLIYEGQDGMFYSCHLGDKTYEPVVCEAYPVE